MADYDAKKLFSDRLKAILKEKKMSGRQLGREVGLSGAQISNYLRGQSFPQPEKLVEISRVLNVPIEYFIEKHFSMNSASKVYNGHLLGVAEKLNNNQRLLLLELAEELAKVNENRDSLAT